MVWKNCALQSCLALAAFSVMTMQCPYQGYAQYSPAAMPKTQAAAEPEGKSLGESATTIIPSLRLAERYDSNVFFLPGKNLEDYVTTVSPQLRATHKNQWVEAILGGGATGEVYAKNPGLNYVGANGNVAVNLDGAMNTFVRGLGLHIQNNSNYTPQPPAFAAPTIGNQVSEAFVQGVQARRADSLFNVARVEATYSFSPYVGISSTYVDSRIRFGKATSTPTGVVASGEFINTNFQTLVSGLVGKPTPTDTISLFHEYRKATFSNPDRIDRGFTSQGAIGRWSRFITPELEAMGEGGVSILNLGGGMYPVGALSLQWQGQYTTVQVSYSRAIRPSFFIASTALLSNAVTATVSHQISEPLSLSVSGSYAVNQSVPDSSLLGFKSYSVRPSLEYKIGRSLTATVSYVRSEFQRDFLGQSVDFDRNMVVLNLLAEWK